MATKSPKIGFISLGCPKALVDSERIMTQLRTDGYELSNQYHDTQLVVVNTCGFIDEAKAESLAAIQEALDENGKVIVTGCLGTHAKEIETQFPNVLAVTGAHAYEAVVGAVHQHCPAPESNPLIDLVPPQGIKLTPRHYAYLKISEGCNHSCRFCIIPSMRGKLVSRPIGEVMDEAQRLVEAGVKELLVISQDTSAYGVDSRYRTGFWQGRPLKTDFFALCEALSHLGIWVRLHYVYPYPHVDRVIPLMQSGNLLPYLDIPFQHASPRILRLMRRPAATEDTLRSIIRWREQCPSLTLRSTFIVGFPGETDSDFESLLDFLDEAQLDRIGCFKYSPVEGAAANELPDHVPEAVKQERFERFMEKQATISAQRLKQKIGQKITIIVDHVNDRGATGRSMSDAPEIDGVVTLENGQLCTPGDLVNAKVLDATAHDLVATMI